MCGLLDEQSGSELWWIARPGLKLPRESQHCTGIPLHQSSNVPIQCTKSSNVLVQSTRTPESKFILAAWVYMSVQDQNTDISLPEQSMDIWWMISVPVQVRVYQRSGCVYDGCTSPSYECTRPVYEMGEPVHCLLSPPLSHMWSLSPSSCTSICHPPSHTDRQATTCTYQHEFTNNQEVVEWSLDQSQGLIWRHWSSNLGPVWFALIIRTMHWQRWAWIQNANVRLKESTMCQMQICGNVSGFVAAGLKATALTLLLLLLLHLAPGSTIYYFILGT